jgi:hypothetical protein|tara:strand:- start:1673 stop:1894 length:222 start_codon:yes stop_codon:yes gene_type:complete
MFSKEEEIIISWQWRRKDLNSRILDLACTLDGDNLQKLSRAFPDHVSALKRFHREEGWFEGVRERKREVETNE